MAATGAGSNATLWLAHLKRSPSTCPSEESVTASVTIISMRRRRTKPRVGITLGDCAGVGPEIVEVALKPDRLARAADYKIIGKYPDCTPGHPTAKTACAAAAALEEAVTLARRG